MRPGGTRHDDFFFPAHRAQEAFQLEFQGFRLRRVEPHVLHDLLERRGAETLPAGLEPVVVAAALREVEREVAVRLKHPELPRTLARHATGRHVRDGAVGELDPRVGDVHVRREQRHPGRPNVHHVRAHELENQIEVVNHEIEDHGHVGAARLERRQPVDLQKPGFVQVRCRRPHGAVEPLDVADLEHDAARGGAAHQILRRHDCIGERLLHEQRDATLKHRGPDLGVCGRGNRNGHGVHSIEQRREGRMCDRLELRRDLGGARGVVVVDAGERDPRHAPQQPRVVKPERSGADDPHPHRRRAHTNTPRCDPSMNLRKFSTSGICGSSARALAIPWLTVMSELNSSR